MKKCKAAIKGCPPDGWPAGRPMKVEELSTKPQASSLEELDPTIDWNKFIDTLKTK